MEVDGKMALGGNDYVRSSAYSKNRVSISRRQVRCDRRRTMMGKASASGGSDRGGAYLA